MQGDKRGIPGPGDVIALLGKGSSFEGKLTFEGTVRIDGKFSGEIFTEGTLVIGEGAEVKAEIEAGNVIVQGNIVGNITATDEADLRAPGRLIGNISAPNVTMEKGAFFDGQCTMGSGAGPSAAARPAARPVATAAATEATEKS